MSNNTFKPVASGDRAEFGRDWVNVVTRSAQAFKRGANSTGGPNLANIKDGLILVQNNSGGDIKIGEVLSIDGALFGPKKNLNEYLFNFAIIGDTVTDADKGFFVVARGPIPRGELGQAYIFGVCPVRVKVGSATDLWAEISTGQKYLQTGSAGSAQILDLGPTEGLSPDVRWALVRLPAGSAASPVGYAKLTADWASPNNFVSASASDAGGNVFSPTVSLTLQLFQHGGAGYSDLKSGHVVAFVPTSSGAGIVISPQPLPTATSQYQVVIASTSGGPPWRADWVRAH